MAPKFRDLSAASLFALLCTVSTPVLAQDSAEDEAAAEQAEMEAQEAQMGGGGAEEGTQATGGGSAELNLLSDEQALQEERSPEEEYRSTTDPIEDPDTNYYFVGLLFRGIFVPSFITELFLESSPAVRNPGVGAEFTYRKDGFDISAAVWWAQYDFEGPFRASGDPPQDTEFLTSDMQTITVNASFLWSTSFNKYVALEYGLDVGISTILGSFDRSEARPPQDGDRSDQIVDGWVACAEPGDGNPEYCDTPVEENGMIPATNSDGVNGAHYGVRARKWTDGGGVPNVLPWLGPHLAVRVKPIKQLALRVEGGFALGFFLGFSAAYGI